MSYLIAGFVLGSILSSKFEFVRGCNNTVPLHAVVLSQNNERFAHTKNILHAAGFAVFREIPIPYESRGNFAILLSLQKQN